MSTRECHACNVLFDDKPEYDFLCHCKACGYHFFDNKGKYAGMCVKCMKICRTCKHMRFNHKMIGDCCKYCLEPAQCLAALGML